MKPRVPTPQALIEQLVKLLPRPAPPRATPGPNTEERILDAALAAFTDDGISATTMSRLARDAGISREWLYKQYRNKDAVVLAVTQREVVRFIDGLAVRSFEADDLPGAVTEAFVYAVEYLQGHELLQRTLVSEADAPSLRIAAGAPPVLGIAVNACASYLCLLGELDPGAATLVAETLVRLAATAAIAPGGAIDLRDPDELRRYAAAVVPAVVGSVTPVQAARRARSRPLH